MKSLLPIGLVFLFVGIAAFSATAQPGRQGRRGDNGVRDRFVGAWRLTSLEQAGADGKVHKIDCSGLLAYTRDGHMSVQVMQREPQAEAPAGSEQYSQGGYEASYGTYEIDERAQTFTFHVEGALVRTLIGQDLPRAYQFSGQRLIVKSARPDEHWRVVWERY